MGLTVSEVDHQELNELVSEQSPVDTSKNYRFQNVQILSDIVWYGGYGKVNSIRSG